MKACTDQVIFHVVALAGDDVGTGALKVLKIVENRSFSAVLHRSR